MQSTVYRFPDPALLPQTPVGLVPHPASGPRLVSLAQLAQAAPWRLNTQHARPYHLFIWTTRGQGLSIVQGMRRGVGTHNALLIPAGTLMSIDLGKQGFGQAVMIPVDCGVALPDEPQHLRIRDVLVQGELTGILDSLQREQSLARVFESEAARAHANLLSIWLRRGMIASEEPESALTAAERLVRAFCSLVERDFHLGRPMADYAATLGVTATHLTRSCRQCAGLTAADILTERTLYAARDLLEGTKLPIQQVAATLGFNSAAYFTRFIQHHTHYSPSDLRKSVRNKTVVAL